MGLFFLGMRYAVIELTTAQAGALSIVANTPRQDTRPMPDATPLNAALRLHLAGNTAAAEAAYRQLISEQSTDAAARHYLGFLLQQNGRLEEALEQLKQALALDDTHAEWFFNLGIVAARLVQHDAAIDAFCRALALDPAPYFYWTNLGSSFVANAEWQRAEQCFLRATQIDPHCPDAFYLMSSLLLQLERYDEARRFNHMGIISAPALATSRILLGQAYYELGQVEAGIAVFETWLAAEPDNPEPAHLLTAYRGQHLPEQCTPIYIEQTYDAFAATFDRILGRLNYSGPQWVAGYLVGLQPPPGALEVLDLGCGTGLVGEVLQPYARKLQGVDLSQAMLAHAAARQIYQQLYKADISAFLAESVASFDLISCMDTLIYIGKLDELFAQVFHHLKPGGLFLFSTETLGTGEAPYQLNISGRYSHHPDYMTQLLQQAGFVLQHRTEGAIRKEAGCPIQGEFICALRPA